ncbi:hypothetical protein [Mesorhizobium sp.]|uniref:hypothetical protein n=1 Tax=Mesorhizobium sp. TaxID=1871066 RepID=UPI0025F16091|nr:hypothetical protein [Mesorhizobium sp.]
MSISEALLASPARRRACGEAARAAESERLQGRNDRSAGTHKGELLLQILYFPLDPYMRGRMDAAKS